MPRFPPVRLDRSSFRLIAAVAGLAALAMAASGGGWTRGFDLRMVDARVALATRAPVAGITLVDIDPRSLREIGVWPWPRELHAGLLGQADRLGARIVAFDMDFSADSPDSGDAVFGQALARSSAETFLAAFVQEAQVGSGTGLVSLPNETLLQRSWPAAVDVPLDPDGRVRRFSGRVATGGEVLDSMPALVAGVDAGRDLFGIDFTIDAAAIPRVSYVDLLNGRVDPAEIAGRRLIVGATAVELRDFFRVPVHGVVSGTTVIALAAETLFQERTVETRPAPLWAYALIALLGLGVLRALRGRHMALALLGSAAAVEGVALSLRHAAGLDLATGGLQLLLLGLFLVGALRAFDLRGLLLAVARLDAANSRRMLERVIEDGFDAVVVLDAQGRVVRSNGAAETMALRSGAPGVPKRVDGFPAAVRAAVAELAETEAVRPLLRRDVEIAAPDGSMILEFSAAPILLDAMKGRSDPPAGNRLVCLTFRDVTEIRRSQEAIRTLALTDALTGLGNRHALEARFEAAVEEGRAPSLLVFEPDRFKSVSDLLGRAVGDLVLVQVAERAKAALGESAFLARTGGSEFAALLPEGGDASKAAGRLLDALDAPFRVADHRIPLGTSVGIASGTGADAQTGRLLQSADVALGHAKQSTGPRRLAVFDPDMERRQAGRMELEADFLQGVEAGEFHLVYQPQVDLASGEVLGAEALLRWTHPRKGAISPQIFIPIAEETGQIHRLGSFALHQACRDAAGWSRPARIAVNVSAVQMQTGDLVEIVDEALAVSGLAVERLELEITESAFVRESPELERLFTTLKSRGIGFALDDFGTGYSSLAYLHRYPISKLKLDKSFVDGLPDDPASLAIVRSVMALTAGLGIRSIAEGIENAEQADALRLLGCREGQGYHYHRPIDAQAMRELLERPRLARAV